MEPEVSARKRWSLVWLGLASVGSALVLGLVIGGVAEPYNSWLDYFASCVLTAAILVPFTFLIAGLFSGLVLVATRHRPDVADRFFRQACGAHLPGFALALAGAMTCWLAYARRDTFDIDPKPEWLLNASLLDERTGQAILAVAALYGVLSSIVLLGSALDSGTEPTTG